MSIAKRVQVCIYETNSQIGNFKCIFFFSNGRHLRVHGTFTIAPGKILSTPQS